MSEDLRKARIRATTIGDLLLTTADQYPDADALVLPDARLTYARAGVASRSRALARLQAIGVQPREHVGLLLPTGFDFVETFFAIAFCGAVAVPVNARYRPQRARLRDRERRPGHGGDHRIASPTRSISSSASPKRLPGYRRAAAMRERCASRQRQSCATSWCWATRRPAASWMRARSRSAARRGARGRGASRAPARAPARHRADALHLRHDGEPEGLPDHARGDGAQLDRARPPPLPAHAGRSVLVAAADVPHRRDPADARDLRRGRDLSHHGLLRRRRRAAHARAASRPRRLTRASSRSCRT